MKHNEHDGITFECDSCDEVLETGNHEWAPAKACFDRAGWKAHQIGNDWIHGCPQHASVR